MRKHKKIKIPIISKIVVSAILVMALVTSAQAVPGDYDGDGTSDLSVALVNRSNNTTAWLTRLSNGATPLFWTFFKAADALVSGRFYAGDIRYYPGVVRVTSASEPLDWTVKSPTGEVYGKFGLPGDIVPNMGDWDGDGRDDFCTVRSQGGVLHWYTFLSGYNQILHWTFGVDGDQVAVADVDGDGRAEMIALRNNFYWYVRKPFELDFTTVQWGVNGDIPLLPADVDGDKKADYFIARKEGVGQNAYIRYGNGQTAIVPMGFASSIPQVGIYGGGRFLAWSQRDTGWTAIKNADGSPNVFRLGIPENAIVRPDGTVVQPTSDAVFPATTPTTPVPPPSDPGSIASCSQTFSSGYLLKPEAQDTGPPREGKPMVLFSRNYPSSSCLNVLATNGEVIAKYGRYASNRYYNAWGCGGSGYSPSALAARAVAASGSKNIVLHDPDTGRCYGPGAADARSDRR